MEITIRPVDELQSFVLKDDHTKVEIYKYEEDEKGIRRPLPERAMEQGSLFILRFWRKMERS